MRYGIGAILRATQASLGDHRTEIVSAIGAIVEPREIAGDMLLPDRPVTFPRIQEDNLCTVLERLDGPQIDEQGPGLSEDVWSGS
jgi:hypothetical protein